MASGLLDGGWADLALKYLTGYLVEKSLSVDNIFVIAVSGMIRMFRYLKPALALILVVVGIKMLAAEWLKEVMGQRFNFYLLGVILLILGSAGIASVIAKPEAKT